MDKKITNEGGLGDLAHMAELDHEVQMARSDLYKIAKYAIKLHDMLKNVSEEQGLEGWVQSKITKAADYMGSVYHNMDYDSKFAEKNKPIEISIEAKQEYHGGLANKLEEAKKKKAKRDACYHKVRSRYSVWPSAYASGALVRCRKVGAANWGNKSKKK